MDKLSFKKGFDQVPVGKVKQIKTELMEALNISSRTSWRSRLKGWVKPSESEIQAIESIFAKYKIKNIWGN